MATPLPKYWRVDWQLTSMQILHDNGFPVPQPIDQARHCIVMELVDAFPLRQAEVTSPAKLYKTLMELILKLANNGLIPGDFNEFNILIHEDSQKAVEADPNEIRVQLLKKASSRSWVAICKALK